MTASAENATQLIASARRGSQRPYGHQAGRECAAASANAAQLALIADRQPPRLITDDQASEGSARLSADGAPAPLSAIGAATRLNAGGTMWRLRSLVAMGHDATRIARAMHARPHAIRNLIRGDTATVTPQTRDLACQLWDAWWDKRPPERTHAQQRAATNARHRAERHGWCTPLGLDEDLLDEPGYRPYTKYRPATGTGVAASFRPAANRANAKESA